LVGIEARISKAQDPSNPDALRTGAAADIKAPTVRAPRAATLAPRCQLVVAHL
jgi:hypothetical protein